MSTHKITIYIIYPASDHSPWINWLNKKRWHRNGCGGSALVWLLCYSPRISFFCSFKYLFNSSFSPSPPYRCPQSWISFSNYGTPSLVIASIRHSSPPRSLRPSRCRPSSMRPPTLQWPFLARNLMSMNRLHRWSTWNLRNTHTWVLGLGTMSTVNSRAFSWLLGNAPIPPLFFFPPASTQELTLN